MLKLRSIAYVIFLLIASLLCFGALAFAEDEPKNTGILPLPDYSGDFTERAYLLGDFGGKRTEWSERGFTFDIDYNQYLQSVVSGGLKQNTEYGGTLDYNVNFDFDRMGLIPGGVLQMTAVSRYGKSVNGITGSIVPANTDATHPGTSELDKDVALMLPVINYTQFLSSQFAIGLGKFQTYGSSNEFAGGEGRSQWWNMNLALPVSAAAFIPYSTSGGVALYMPTPTMVVSGMIGSKKDSSDTFFDFDDGTFGLLSLSNQYQLNELPGGFGVMASYAWDTKFTEIDGRFNFINGKLEPSTKENSWFLSADFWQYLWLEDGPVEGVDSADGRQDHQGVGMFGRVQIADDSTNPVHYVISVGLNAKGLIPTRDNDCMGLGLSHNKLNQGRFLKALEVADTSTVVEIFYNIEFTPAVHLTLDAQLADSSLPSANTAKILGTSLQVVF